MTPVLTAVLFRRIRQVERRFFFFFFASITLTLFEKPKQQNQAESVVEGIFEETIGTS